MPNSPKAWKECSKRERELGRMSEEDLNPFRKSIETERSPSRSEEGNENHAQRDERGSEREETRARKRGHTEIV
jgi:hypothetical protein